MSSNFDSNEPRLPRDESQRRLSLLADKMASHQVDQSYTVADRFEELVSKHPSKTFLIYETYEYSYSQANENANRFARLGLSNGLNVGDSVGLMIENRPEFFFIFLGMAKIGVTVTLINYQQSGDGLRHVLRTAAVKALFFGTECCDSLESIRQDLDGHKLYAIPDESCKESDAIIGPLVEILTPTYLESFGEKNIDPKERDSLKGGDALFNIFTSGTTGFPKAAIVSHAKWLAIGDGMSSAIGVNSEDRYYCVLPLYHGQSAMTGASTVMAASALMILKRKFSVREFYDDLSSLRFTMFGYVGEVCRYILNAETFDFPEEFGDSSLRLMQGAGLSAEIWRPFAERFGVERVIEGWGATEANCGIVNLDNAMGSVGRIPFQELSNLRLIKYDTERDCLVRDARGRLIECQPGEVGEAVGRINEEPGRADERFSGYTDIEESQKKILHGVFVDGDSWFRSGDLLYRDEHDYYYFVDRIGDTFRWNGENVSTTEVQSIIGDSPNIVTANVYGVTVDGYEGRAGMAAIVPKGGVKKFDPSAFYQFICSRLPGYAIPRFLRICRALDTTGTFKLKKVDLCRQGYDSTLIDQPLYILDRDSQTYRTFNSSETDLASLRL